MTTIADLIYSNTANAKGIPNSPTQPQLANLAWLTMRVDMTKKLLAAYNPHLTSGFRSKALSVAVGGNEHDEHTDGRAFDLDCHLGDADAHLIPARLVFDNRHIFGGSLHQVIAERGHVHCGFYSIGKVGPCELRVSRAGHYPLLDLKPW